MKLHLLDLQRRNSEPFCFMEWPCNLTSALALALVFLCSFLLLDSYHVNLFSSRRFILAQCSISKSSSANAREEQFPHYPVNITNHNLAGAEQPWRTNSVREIQAKAKGKRRVVPRVEMELKRARAAIRKAARFRNADAPSSAYIPRGAIYRNGFTFQQSYAEMEKRFKIFVYAEGEMPLVHHGPCKDIYTTEGRFIHELQLGNPFLTSNPEEAHVFFLPFSVVMMVSYVYRPKSYDLAPIKRFISDYIQVVANKYSYWNRSLGADHFMLSCHDWAPRTSMANQYLHKNAIRVLCNANTSEGFNPAKDATLPEMNLKNGSAIGMVGGKSALRRPILAFFAGGNHGSVRPLLFKLWKRSSTGNSDSDIHVYEYLPKESSLSYYDMMKKSKYCLCPSGYEVASPRIVEAIYSGCVPVIISDNYVLPFSDVLNWKAFSVHIPISQIPNLRTVLESISLNRYVQMQKRLKLVQTHFSINQPPKPYDMFHMILHSIWLRRLNVQLMPDH